MLEFECSSITSNFRESNYIMFFELSKREMQSIPITQFFINKKYLGHENHPKNLFINES